MPSKIEWLNGGDTWNPIIARVRPDAADIARAKGYTSLVQIAEKQVGKRGHHCEHVHAGCSNCYAEAMNGRCLTHMGTGLPYDRRSRDLVEMELHEPTLMQPLKWRRGRHVFPCSMTDLFGEWVPDEFIDLVFAVMAMCPQHRFICLTKRPERMADYVNMEMAQRVAEDCMRYSFTRDFDSDYEFDARESDLDEWPLPNVILGTSASDQATFDAAAPHMRALAAAGWNTLWSMEPLLGEVDMSAALTEREPTPAEVDSDRGFHYLRHGAPWASWVIVGSESGHGARPMNEDWVRGIRDQCVDAGVPFFYKQKTVAGKKIGLPSLDGMLWTQLPEVLR